MMYHDFAFNKLFFLTILCLLPATCLAQYDQYDQNTYANEGFTEAVEIIEIAASEMGIVKEVHVELGQKVRKDELLVSLDTNVLEASREMARVRANGVAKLRAAETEHATKLRRYEKLKELLKQGAGRPEEVEKANSDVELASHSITAIREELEVFSFEVKELEARIERRRIRSSIDGFVTELYRKPGEHVSSNEPLIAQVVNLEKLRVVFHLPTSVAMKTNVADHFEVYLAEIDAEAKAVVQYVAPITSADSGRVRIDCLIDNSEGKYRSGIRCRIKNNRVSNQALTLPEFKR